MNKYIAYFNDSSCQSLRLYSSIDSLESYQNFSNIQQLNFLEENEMLIVLIPSVLVTSYEDHKNEDVSDDIHLANFSSSIDNTIVNQISDNNFIFHEGVGYIVENSIVEDFNKSLTLLNTNILLTPEYSFFAEANRDIIVEFDNKYFFSYAGGSGTSITNQSLQEYSQLIKNNNHNYKPTIYSSSDSLKKIFPDNKCKEFSLDMFLDRDINLLPNFYKFFFSYNSLKSKFNFTSMQFGSLIFSLILILLMPLLIINDNNKNAEAYKNATFDIFTSINSDIKNVVRPRSQIDSIMSSATLREKGDDIKLPSLEFLDLIDTANLEKILISFNQSTATITIKDMPSLQFKAIKALAKKMNIVILNEETISLDNSVSGLIEVSIDNE